MDTKTNCVNNECRKLKSDCCNENVSSMVFRNSLVNFACTVCNNWCNTHTNEHCSLCINKINVELLIEKRNSTRQKYQTTLKELETMKAQIKEYQTELNKICNHDFTEHCYEDGGHGRTEYTCKICEYVR